MTSDKDWNKVRRYPEEKPEAGTTTVLVFLPAYDNCGLPDGGFWGWRMAKDLVIGNHWRYQPPPPESDAERAWKDYVKVQERLHDPVLEGTKDAFLAGWSARDKAK